MNTETHGPSFETATDYWDAALVTIDQLGLSVDATERVGQLTAMTGQGIMDVATTLHTALAPGLDHEPTTYTMHVSGPDGENRRPTLDPSERSVLFDEAAGLVRSLSEMDAPDNTEERLARIGDVVALAVLLAHPFEDGNGRTARTMAQLIREGYDGSEQAVKDFKVLGANRPTTGYRIKSYAPRTGVGDKMSPSELLAIAASLDIPLDENKKHVARKERAFDSPFAD